MYIVSIDNIDKLDDLEDIIFSKSIIPSIDGDPFSKNGKVLSFKSSNNMLVDNVLRDGEIGILLNNGKYIWAMLDIVCVPERIYEPYLPEYYYEHKITFSKRLGDKSLSELSSRVKRYIRDKKLKELI